MTDNGRRANPNAKINTVLLPNPKDKSNINVTFRDGKTMDFDASTMKIT
ncbi:5987_t:CDS:2, partial [Paraglomus occultum]